MMMPVPQYPARLNAAREAMDRAGFAALLLGPGADLRYLTGYEALPLERLTLLVLPTRGEPALIVPELERRRAESQRVDVPLRPWSETEDPFVFVSKALAGVDGVLGVADRLWATFLLRLQAELPGATFRPASQVTTSLRVRKDEAEVAALREVARLADGVAEELAEERIGGRTERELSRWISDRLLAAGCERVNFAIVAAGENAASPHHEPSGRPIRRGDALVCDFGGTLDGYCSDITRTFSVGDPGEELLEVHRIVEGAQEAGVRAAVAGATCASVDAAARSVIAAAGHGEAFIHRTGHGIGLEEHEEPYLVAGNDAVLGPGMAFSVEPGIYLAGYLGVRIEDIVVCTSSGPERLNNASHDLVEIAP